MLKLLIKELFYIRTNVAWLAFLWKDSFSSIELPHLVRFSLLFGGHDWVDSFYVYFTI